MCLSLKTGMDFRGLKARSENGCEKLHFLSENRAAHPHQEFPGVTPHEGEMFPNVFLKPKRLVNIVK